MIVHEDFYFCFIYLIYIYLRPFLDSGMQPYEVNSMVKNPLITYLTRVTGRNIATRQARHFSNPHRYGLKMWEGWK
jgi:hypothetical protein